MKNKRIFFVDFRVPVESLRRYGFEAKVALVKEEFVYEMKIPLEVAKRTPCSIVLGEGKIISIGFEGAMLEASPVAGGMLGGGKGGGRSGGPMGGGIPGKLKAWFKVRLAD